MTKPLSLGGLLLIIQSSSVFGAVLPRRTFLSGWLGAAVGGVVTPALPRAPAIVSRASPAMLRGRALQIGALMKYFFIGSERYWGTFTDVEQGIIEDWIAQAPVERMALAEELRRHVAASDYQNGGLSGEALVAAADAGARRREAIVAQISEWPWSTLDWTEVYRARLALAEDELAPTLGQNIDVARVHQLTEHALAGAAEYRETSPVLEGLSDDAYDSEEPPLYSTKTVEALAAAFERVVPALGAALRRRNAAAEIEPDQVRCQLFALVRRGDYFPECHMPLHFLFNGDSVSKPIMRPIDRLAADYVRALGDLTRLGSRLAALDDSPLRDIALEQLGLLTAELRTEVETLPSRLHDYNAHWESHRTGKSSWTNATWGGHVRPADALATVESARWVGVLKSLMVNAGHLNGEGQAGEAVKCDQVLSTSNTPLLEHQTTVVIDAGSNEDAADLSPSIESAAFHDR